MEPAIPTNDPWTHSQLFTLRVWVERLDAEHREVRMQVRHVLSGETHFFCDWTAVTAYMMTNLDSPRSDV